MSIDRDERFFFPDELRADKKSLAIQDLNSIIASIIYKMSFGAIDNRFDLKSEHRVFESKTKTWAETQMAEMETDSEKALFCIDCMIYLLESFSTNYVETRNHLIYFFYEKLSKFWTLEEAIDNWRKVVNLRDKDKSETGLDLVSALKNTKEDILTISRDVFPNLN